MILARVKRCFLRGPFTVDGDNSLSISRGNGKSYSRGSSCSFRGVLALASSIAWAARATTGTGQPQLPGQHQQESSAVSISGRGLVCNVGALLVLRVPRSQSVYVTAEPVLSLNAVHSPLAWMARSRRSFWTSAIARFRAGPAAAGWQGFIAPPR